MSFKCDGCKKSVRNGVTPNYRHDYREKTYVNINVIKLDTGKEITKKKFSHGKEAKNQYCFCTKCAIAFDKEKESEIELD